MWWTVRGAVSLVLSDTLANAARGLAPGESLTTGRLLDAVARMDVHGDWRRIWLIVGDPERTGLAAAPDPPDPPVPAAEPARWAGVPLSGSLAEALRVAGRISDEYSLRPVPSGVVALGLVARRGYGATEALLAGRGATHAQVLHAIQTDVLRITLTDLDAIIPAATRP